MFDSVALAPFAGETRRGQAATVLGGAVAAVTGFVAVALVVSGDPLAATAGATERRLATAGASAACWGYYGVAFVRGRGGPVRNVLLYPLVTVGVATALLRWDSFGSGAGALSVRSLLLDPLVSAAFAVLPGVAWLVAVLWVWGASLDEAERREWMETHLTGAFRAEFVED